MSRLSASRRSVLAGMSCAAAWLSQRTTAFTQAALPVRIVGNSGLENNTLQRLLRDQGYLEQMGLAPTLVGVTSPIGTLEALVADKGDICMISGFNGLLPAIENGAPVRVVGAAMRLTALAVYAKTEGISSVADLVGKRIGIGPEKGLLHSTMVGLLRKKGIDPAQVQFVSIGSNAQVFQAVSEGKVDAGPSDVANMTRIGKLGMRALPDGLMWKELPDYPYQLVYASTKAIAEQREALIRTLAGYARMYRFLSSAESWLAYSQARMAATQENNAEDGRSAWNFIQEMKPYALEIAVSPAQIAFIQQLHVLIGSQKAVLPFDKVADMSLAREALARLG